MTEQTTKTEAKKKPVSATGSKIAVILLRGWTKSQPDAIRTGELLHLHSRMNCRVLDDTPVIRGMLQRIKDYIAFGPVSAETEKLLEARRNRDNFTLHPPRGGFERGGIKKPWVRGGALGLRDEMDTLIKKML